MFSGEFTTTFPMDFSIADRFGVGAVKDTYERAFEEWKNDVVYMSELEIVLNWKIWEYFDKGNEELAHTYNDLWEKCRDYNLEHFEGEDARIHFEMTD